MPDPVKYTVFVFLGRVLQSAARNRLFIDGSNKSATLTTAVLYQCQSCLKDKQYTACISMYIPETPKQHMTFPVDYSL